MIFKEDYPTAYLITQGKFTAENFNVEKKKLIKMVKLAVEAKISLIQIREKNLTAKLVYNLTREVAEVVKNSDTKILVNDRADIALAANADGVHLTSKSLPTKKIRKNFPSKFIIGVSTHSLEKAQQAKDEGSDFITFSPIFFKESKIKYGDPQGLGKLQQVCEKLEPFPVIALGGLDAENYQTVLRTGAKGFASIEFLNNTENLRKLNL
ncbi:MAG: thiamine phosphate synthase [Acidobacteriota bacterium]|jgi:thiamine-phosphate pyrophosphorylase|nr:thiamine phosphate synthase [Acidobacteriota bacterium]